MPPRGGRGGAGAGRPRPPAGKVRIGGIDIEYDEDTQQHVNERPQPAETYPSHKTEAPRPLTAVEKEEVARYFAIRDLMHKGPMYTTFDDTAKAEKPGQKRKPAAATFDAFNGLETYSMRYTTTKRRPQALSALPHELRYFPEELHAVLDPDAKTTGSKKRKNLQTDFDEEQYEIDLADMAVAEDDDEDAANKPPVEEGDVAPEEEVDDNFENEDDEDDDAGNDDYNAEQYFDDGEDDKGDDDADPGDYD